MALRTDRFVLEGGAVVAVSRGTERYYDDNPDEGVSGPRVHYRLEIFFSTGREGDSMYLDYGTDEAARDAAYETVAAEIA